MAVCEEFNWKKSLRIGEHSLGEARISSLASNVKSVAVTSLNKIAFPIPDITVWSFLLTRLGSRFGVWNESEGISETGAVVVAVTDSSLTLSLLVSHFT